VSVALPTYDATRYLVPLKEGGSLPAVVDTDGGGLFVTKFRGAGQGAKALIAEVIVGALAIEVGLPMPEMALINLESEFARTEPDPEIQDILGGSRGLNFGIRYLDGALNFDPVAARHLVDGSWATRLVWLDALVTNLDRTPKNPNMLVWEDEIWLIDHGAALYAHHDWARTDDARARTPFKPIEKHVLLEWTGDLPAVDRELVDRIGLDAVDRALGLVPDTWLVDPLSGDDFKTPSEARQRYLDFFAARLREPRAFVTEAMEARDRALAEPSPPLSSRR
jgi:hypothetical protein